MEDSLVDLYYEKIRNSKNLTSTFVSMISNLLGFEVTSELYQTVAKLQKIYGVKNLFFSVLDCADMETIDLNNSPYGLLAYFLKKRLESKFTFKEETDLTNLANQNLKAMEKHPKIKVVAPFNGDKNE